MGEFRLYTVDVLSPKSLLIKRYLVRVFEAYEPNGAQKAIRIIEEKNASETEEGEPMYPVDSLLSAEPIEWEFEFVEMW